MIYQECFNNLVEIYKYGLRHIEQESIPVSERSEIVFSLENLKSNRDKIKNIGILYRESPIGQQKGNYYLYPIVGKHFEIILTMHDFKVQKIRLSSYNRNVSEKSVVVDKEHIIEILKGIANRYDLVF